MSKVLSPTVSTSVRQKPFCRRDLLLGLGAGSLLLGPLGRPRLAFAQTPQAQRRFLVFFTSNGHASSGFGTNGSGASFSLNPGMSGAESVKDHVSYINRLSLKNRSDNVRDFHNKLPALLTGKTTMVAATAQGASIDQVVADLSGKAPLTLKVYTDSVRSSEGNSQLLSWKAPGLPNRNEDKPVSIYRNVFEAALPTEAKTDEGAKRILEQNKSVLDYNLEDLKLFQGRLQNAESRQQLEVHLERIRFAEKGVADALASGGSGGAVGGVCNNEAAKQAGIYVPPKQEGVPYNIPNFEKHGDVTRQLLVAAFACGLKTAGSVMWQWEGGGINPAGGAGKEDDHHFVSHGEGGPAAWQRIDTYYSGQFAKYLNDFKTAGILDDTVVVWATLLRNNGPADHCHNDLKFVVGGGKNLGIRHRQTIDLPSAGGDSARAAQGSSAWGVNDLWTTVLQAMGGKGNFGDHTKGVIPALWAPA